MSDNCRHLRTTIIFLLTYSYRRFGRFLTASQDAKGVQLPLAFRLWITRPVREIRRHSRAVPTARTPRWTQTSRPVRHGPRQPLHRDDIAAFGAQSVSMILHQHDYRTIQLGDFDRQLSRSRGGPVGISRGSGRRWTSITNQRDECHRGGWELSAIRQGAVTP